MATFSRICDIEHKLVYMDFHSVFPQRMFLFLFFFVCVQIMQLSYIFWKDNAECQNWLIADIVWQSWSDAIRKMELIKTSSYSSTTLGWNQGGETSWIRENKSIKSSHPAEYSVSIIVPWRHAKRAPWEPNNRFSPPLAFPPHKRGFL